MLKPDHGGGVDHAAQTYGIARENWLDLSTGINPVSYPLTKLNPNDWGALPDTSAMDKLLAVARTFWKVPNGADVIAAAGVSQLIAQLPRLATLGTVDIPSPTYNEHARAFRLNGWLLGETQAQAKVLVHPNNPDGRLWQVSDMTAPFNIIDESFCDVMPQESHISLAATKGTIVLKSFGKFWGLAGVRLGFAIGDPEMIDKLRDMLGPWAVSGPALKIGTQALLDNSWAENARTRLTRDATRLDQIMTQNSDVKNLGGTSLFRLYDVQNANFWQDSLGKSGILGRIFPYSQSWLRLGLPADDLEFSRLESTINGLSKAKA